ncbi:MAG: hypothetical protein KGV44_04925 [Flavobacteriaceae bacterium]|nr:hypothetical protein [Flavobacteriaceae bacterium]
MNKENNQFELEKQLHEQYAINNNESIKSFLTFIGALFALLGGVGYVIIHSNNRFTEGLITEKTLSIEAFFLCVLVVSGMLFFLSLISLQLGYSNRNNQIVIDKIRDANFGSNSKKLIFGEYYKSAGKTFWSFIQDYFNLFYWLFVVAQFFIIGLTIFNMQNSNCCVTMLILLQIALLCGSILFRYHYFLKYKKRTK